MDGVAFFLVGAAKSLVLVRNVAGRNWKHSASTLSHFYSGFCSREPLVRSLKPLKEKGENVFAKISYILGAGVLGLCAAIVGAQDPQDIQKDSSKFMQRKLDYTRTVVDGLATEDFQKIAKGAQDLMLLSHEADWKVVTTPEYLKMSQEFRETTERLRNQGQQKNLDGAALAYFEVTLNCIRCHKQLRGGAPIINGIEK